MNTLYQHEADNKAGHVCVKASPDTETTANPKQVAQFKCNCHYLWLREVHGLSTLMMSNSREEKLFWFVVIIMCCALSIVFADSIMEAFVNNQFTTKLKVIPVKKLQFPALVFCPKYGDSIHLEPLLLDMRSRVPMVEDDVAYDVIRYLIAGSGIDNVRVDVWDEEYRGKLDSVYKQWRGNRTQLHMFDYVFSQNGYTCQEMFHLCYAGSRDLDCCKVFEPTFVMMRGRCFRLIDSYYQTDVDETDRLSVFFNRVQGPLLQNSTRPQLVTYITDHHPETGLYPRVYLSLNDWNRLRFVQRKISMIPENNLCSTDPLNQGKSTCFVYNWINRVLVKPLNCTLPFFKTMLPYLAHVPVCEPMTILQHYHTVTSTIVENYKCLPACERTENYWQMTNSIDTSPSPKYAFRVEASFTDLEYEDYSEIRLTTPARFISELGGQSGLFVGCSVMTFVQGILSIVVFLYDRARRTYLGHLAVPLTLR
ncbi:hypothetical protein Aduo_013409 [Ancylostoma duodenale]